MANGSPLENVARHVGSIFGTGAAGGLLSTDQETLQKEYRRALHMNQMIAPEQMHQIQYNKMSQASLTNAYPPISSPSVSPPPVTAGRRILVPCFIEIGEDGPVHVRMHSRWRDLFKQMLKNIVFETDPFSEVRECLTWHTSQPRELRFIADPEVVLDGLLVGELKPEQVKQP